MKKLMLLLFVLAGILLTSATSAYAFCGFFVAKADAKLFNKSSQVIIVRDGDRTVITMSNDFEGNVRDFAMVVPVPEVLSRENIRIAQQGIFDKMDAYSAPRIAEYYDQDPCYVHRHYSMMEDAAMPSSVAGNSGLEVKQAQKKYSVTIEATYTVGEYDILILSAKESVGLKHWLTDNGYKIPSDAHEVLDPYIRSNLKFFVVKVNLEKHKKTGSEQLRPLQIAFQSDKFMLPIRLGMANSEGDQDLIVYTLTRKGRVETVNYRTVKLPTDKEVPLFVKNQFGEFYSALFNRIWNKEGQKAVVQEYSWDLSSTNFVKCDPCAIDPPAYADLREAGVFWMRQIPSRWGSSDYEGDLHFTRLHVRYNRKNYPQDLVFQETPDKSSFQGRYVVHNPPDGLLQCEAGQQYIRELSKRRQKEVNNLASLTGWNPSKHQDYVKEYNKMLKDDNRWIEDSFINKNTFLFLVSVFQNRLSPTGRFLLYLAGIALLLTAINLLLVKLRQKQIVEK